jgi:hypothetical protein
VRGLADLHLLETPDDVLLREVTGVELEPSGHALLDGGPGVRSTQRLALGNVGGGIVVFTWPGELQPQAKYLYTGDRAQRLLAAAAADDWEVDVRPHLAFWLSTPEERAYLNPTLDPEEYVARWSGPDRGHIRQHEAAAVETELWRWLLERGHASRQDEVMLGPYVKRLTTRKRAAHLRPGLRLLRRWSAEDVQHLRRHGALAGEIVAPSTVCSPQPPARDRNNDLRPPTRARHASA